ncbi:MAG: hypothetical protein V2A54_16980 [Bacteroidota bacterium]
MKMIPDMHFNTARRKLLKLLIIAVLFIFIGLTISSCKKEPDPIPPIIVMNSGSGLLADHDTLAPGTLSTLSITVTPGSVPITNLTIKITNNNNQVVFDSGMYSDAFTLNKTFIKGVGIEDLITVTVMDDNRQKASVSFTLHKDPAFIFQPVLYIPSVVFGAHLNTSIGSFFSFIPEQLYFLPQAYNNQSLIDLCCYYDYWGDENTIASPGANIDTSIYSGMFGLQNWSTKNETRFIETTFTASEFDAVVNDSLALATYDAVVAKRKAKNLVSGEVFVFRTSAYRYGLLKVIQVNGTDTGTVEIAIKIQQP